MRWQEIGDAHCSVARTLSVIGDRWTLLILRDAFAEGWRAEVDGSSVEIKRADYLFRAVRVPAGRRVVRFEYRAPGFRPGVITGLIALALLAALTFLPSRHSWKPHGPRWE